MYYYEHITIIVMNIIVVYMSIMGGMTQQRMYMYVCSKYNKKT